jgi:putative DNA primase/helicase
VLRSGRGDGLPIAQLRADYTNRDDQIQIYSRAHGDAFAYVASLDSIPWAELFTRITGVQTVAGIATPTFSEDAIALAFTARHLDEVRYTAKWGQWHLWDGQRWIEDRKREVFNKARTICREVARVKKKANKTLANNKTKMGVLGLAMDDQRTAAVAEQWDADIWKLCTPGGMVDLQTGKIQPALPSDYCTMMTSVAPGGSCPLWMAFLNTVTEGDQALIRFLQVCCGYALTGSTREQILLFLWGRGGNGKSVFIETITGVMGDYHTGAAMDTFVETKGGQDRHPTDMAGLRGARLVTAAETEQGRRWAESKIKTMTGSDKITARFMRQDFFTYVPQYTLMIYGNFKPGLKSVDEAIRRRMKLIPFTVTIAKDKRDKDLITKLKEEWGGILKWMIEGCMIWQRDGLVTPQCEEAATAEYLHEEDLIGRWIEECCTRDPQALTPHSVLFEAWKGWAERARAYIGSSKQLAAELKARNFASKDMTQGLAFIGLKVANPFADLADTLFMDLLKAQKEPVSPNEDDENYAPKVFASQQTKANEPTLAAAMQRLLKSGKIKTHGTVPTLAVAQPH